MFRKLTNKNKSLPDTECFEILERETRGTLSVQGDDGYPYGMPMNHYYCAEDGCIYFHCGKDAHRTDALKRSNKVSFGVCEHGYRNEGEWALNVRSVIVICRIETVDDIDTVCSIAEKLSRKFTQDEEYIRSEIEKFAKVTTLLRLKPENICGKRVSES